MRSRWDQVVLLHNAVANSRNRPQFEARKASRLLHICGLFAGEHSQCPYGPGSVELDLRIVSQRQG